MPSRVESIGADTVRLDTPSGPEDITNDFVFVFAGGEPPFQLLRDAGIRVHHDDRADFDHDVQHDEYDEHVDDLEHDDHDARPGLRRR